MLGAIGALIVRSVLFEGIYLKTDSMAPTLPQESHVFVSKLAYVFKSPERGDIVVFTTPQQPDKGLVKRVIAIAGDTLEIKAKKVILNGKELYESYAQHIHPEVRYTDDNLGPISIPEGHVFVMGDNRDVSGDSRDWKDAAGNWSPYVSIKNIQGRVLLPN
jgi:signal peptidase I